MLYEFKPTLWAILGLICVLSFDNWMGRSAGALFITTAIFTFNLRLIHRSKT